ncbi:Ubiqutin conjugating enzyme 2 [Aphelenchoides besseyi]|nr:Ubiqutin conjugating enzyme 2 [Aphelenchoides besseyi]
METTTSAWPKPLDNYTIRTIAMTVLISLIIIFIVGSISGIVIWIWYHCQKSSEIEKAKAKEAEQQMNKNEKKTPTTQGNASDTKLKTTEIPKMELGGITEVTKNETQALKTVDGIDPTGINKFTEKFLGNKETPFEGGYYYGQIKFDADFPFKPPAYKMCTPSGRFTYHKENWNPLWTAGALINGFIQLFHDVSEKHFIGAYPNQSKEVYKKNAELSKSKLLEVLEKKLEIKELFSDIVVQIKSELNGAEPSNRLPFSAEHLEWKSSYEYIQSCDFILILRTLLSRNDFLIQCAVMMAAETKMPPG